MAFFESLRAKVGRYAIGVHHLPAPADKCALAAAEQRLGAKLPESLRDFLLSFDGILLFHESHRLFSASELGRREATPRYLHVGETPDGALYMPLEGEGCIYLVDEEAPDPILCGSRTESWLDATLAREGLLVDREGEFREVFTSEGLSKPVQRKRTELGLRHDPKAALYLLERAEQFAEEGEIRAAILALQQAVTLDPQAGPAWELLATLYLDSDETEAGQHAALQAAQATWHPPLAEARKQLALRIRTRNALRIV